MNKEIVFPIAVDVEEGKTYHWCGCGKSKSQPFCDRKGCDKSVLFHAEINETLYFCACKHTKDPPLCDGSHAQLLRKMIHNQQK